MNNIENNKDTVQPIYIDDEETKTPLQKAKEEALVDWDEESSENTTQEQSTQSQEADDIPPRKQHRAIQIFDHSSKQVWNTDAITIVVPGDHDKETRNAIQRAPNVSYVDSPAARDWATVLQEGLEMSTFAEGFIPTLEDETAEFHQAVDVNGVKLIGQSPRFKPAENENLKGERAVIRMMSHLGLGGLFQVPLWHTGIWVTLKPPTESEIVELNRIMAADKIQYGRFTYGLAFANMSSFTVARLVDFVIDHIYDTTAKTDELPINELKKIVPPQDYPSLLWGLVCTMYPNGFQYRRACSSDPEKCNHVLEETLNVSKLQWTNVNALTDWQKTHMAGRQPKSKDKASILRYKEELKRLQNTTFSIGEENSNSVTFVVGTPSIADYIEAGQRWIGEITEIVERALGVENKDEERNKFIRRHSQASAMRNLMHWIRSIEMGSNTIDDRETIESTLNVLSGDDDIRKKYNEAIIDYINKSTISIIGIPVYDCPGCKTTQETKLTSEDFKNIIPLDVMQLFFALLYQKLGKITAR